MEKLKRAFLGIAAGFANGLFGSGGGSIIVPGMQKVLNIEQHKAHATAIAVILPLTIISAFVYFKSVEVDWGMILWISAGGAVGGFIGARLLNKISGRLLHKVFGGVLIVAAIKMII